VLAHDGLPLSAVRRVTIGFSAVPSLLAGRVDAVVAFWNAEGVTLRRRGVHTDEFRVDRYGAPRYPELVLAVTRETLRRRRDLVRDVLAALRDGTREALADPSAAVAEVARASREDPASVRAQLGALAPALSPPLRLSRPALAAWARFDVRFGILDRRPDLRRAFALPSHP
jgi:NitT/TauT family transport system substrate-binding protein/putative hydroxymethylpyrimidine transport system substrate-binding protein